MSRRTLPVLSLLVLGAVVAWLFWSDSVVEVPAEGAPLSAEQLDAGMAEIETFSDSLERDELTAVPEMPAEAASEYAAPSTADDALTIEVFDTTTGRLAPGAEVYYADRGLWDDETRDEAWQLEDSWTGIGLRYGTKYLCDAEGRVKVPMRTAHATITAQIGGRRGATGTLAMPDGRAETIRIEVNPIRSLTAHVLQADGTPAPNCMVGMVNLQGRGQWVQGTSYRTDADGLVHFKYLEEQPLGRGGSRPHLAVIEALDVPLRVEILPAKWPTERIEFRLPATGSVDVQVRAETGVASAEEGHVTLSRVQEEDRSDPSSNSWRVLHLGTGGTALTDSSGVAHFDYVSPGMPLKIQLAPTKTRNGAAALADKAALVGETVLLSISPGLELSFVTCRVVRPDGTPCSSQQLDASVYLDQVGGSRAGGHWVRSDEEGTVRVRLPEADSPQGHSRLLEISELRAATPSVARLHATPIPDHLEPGDNPLGELVLGGRPLVAGVVLDPDYAPVADVSVLLCARKSQSYRRVTYARTGPDGRFEFDCESPDTDLFLLLQPPDPFEHTEVDLQAGQGNLRIVLKSDTALSGKLLLPPGVPNRLVTIKALADDRSWGGRAWNNDGDVFFRLEDIPPNVDFTLTVQSWNDDAPYFEGHYQLQEGEQSAPAELNPLDLTEGIHLHRLSVLQEDGSVPPSCQFEITLSDGTVKSSSIGGSNLFQTLSRYPELNVLAMAPGCVPQRVAVRGEAEVRLLFGPAITISADLPTMPEGFVLVLHLQGSMDVGRERAANLREEVVLTESGGMQVRLPQLGVYRVSATLEPTHRMGHEYRVSLPVDSTQFNARAGGTYHLTLPADAFTEAMPTDS